MDNWWYLSFVDNDVFLGGCYVQGRTFILAVGRSHELGINPGGEVVGLGPMTEEWVREDGTPLNTLLRKEDLFEPVHINGSDA